MSITSAMLATVEEVMHVLRRDRLNRLRVTEVGWDPDAPRLAEIVHGGDTLAVVDPNLLPELERSHLVRTNAFLNTVYLAPLVPRIEIETNLEVAYTVGIQIDGETTVSELVLPQMDRMTLRKRVIDEAINVLAEHPDAASVTVSFRWAVGRTGHVTHRLTSHTLP